MTAAPRRPETIKLNHREARRERIIIGAMMTASFGGALYCAYLLSIGEYSRSDLILFFGMALFTATGIEVGFHRHFAHRSFKARPVVRLLLGVAGCMAGQGPISYWVSNHRLHHLHSDDDEDPHSPKPAKSGVVNVARGLFHAHLLWMFSSRRASQGMFARDLLGDPFVRMIDSRYFQWVLLGIVAPGVANGLLTQSSSGLISGCVFGGLARLFVVDHVVYSVNSICHTFGSRPFDTGDRSRNNLILALPTLGQAWHNNHHAFPASAKMGLRWWEVDLGYIVISALRLLSLVSEVVVPSRERVRDSRQRSAKMDPTLDD